jgi:toxin ParE1/3/4
MAHKRFSYELSQEADKYLEEIYDYTTEQFGIEQAIKYLLCFETVFENLCNNPESGRKRNEISKGLRSISNESHTIFYRILEDHLRIVRILHGSRDIIKFLPSQD